MSKTYAITMGRVLETQVPCSGGCGQPVTLRVNDEDEIRRIMRATGVSHAYAQSLTARSGGYLHRKASALHKVEAVCPSCMIRARRASGGPREKVYVVFVAGDGDLSSTLEEDVAVYVGGKRAWMGTQAAHDEEMVSVAAVLRAVGVPFREVEVTLDSLMVDNWPEVYPGDLIEKPRHE